MLNKGFAIPPKEDGGEGGSHEGSRRDEFVSGRGRKLMGSGSGVQEISGEDIY